MKTQLYKYDGTPLFEVIVDDTSTQDWSLMSDNKLSVSFELEECVVLTAGCYIEFDGTRFYLLNEYKPTMICSSAWKYDLTLGDAASWLSITLALKTIDGENTPLFKYTGPAAEHAAIIVANLNRRMGTDQWKVGSVISTENIAIDYSGKYCSEVLQEIVDAKDTEWWIDGMTLNIGRAEFGESVTLGYMNGALGDIVCDTAGDMRSYAYLFPIGSTRNIDPTKYGHDRLQLPSGLVSVPINPEQGIAELKEEAAFAHIYPRYEGTISAVRYARATNEDGTPFLIYYIKDTSIPFNPNEYEIAGLVKHITFNSGELMGQEFEVNYSADSNEFELITRWTGEIQLPGGVLVPAVGDKYVVWNISMPDVYYTIASHELLDAARAFAADAVKDVSVYKVKLDYIEVQERGLKLRPGQRVRLMSDEYFASGYYDSRITRITRNIAYPDELSVDISAVRVVGTLSRLQASIQKTENVVAQFSGQLPAIIKSNDDTSADDSSVYTSAKSEKEFLNKRKGGKVAAPITFDEVAEFLNGLVAHKYIKIGNGYLRYNDELGVWEMVGDLLVTGAVTMFGSLSSFKPSTITDAVLVDGETIVKTKNSQGQWQLTAIGRGGGTGGGISAAEVNILINNALKPYALSTSIPTDNKQLSNGAGYATVSDLDTRINNLINGAPAAYDTLKEIADVLAGNINSIGDILTALDTKATKTYVDGELAKYILKDTAQDISARHNFVDGLQIGGLPITKSASANNTIYLDANLVVSGAITMFGSGSTTFPTIWANIPFNLDHMSWDGSQWNIIGGGGTGSVDDATVRVIVNEVLGEKGYATEKWVIDKDYATVSVVSSAISSALVGYATQGWVGNNYLSQGGGTIEGDSGALDIKRNSNSSSFIKYSNTNGVLGYLGFLGTNAPYFWDNSLTPIGLIHERNVKDFVQEYALPITGGVVNGSITAVGNIYLGDDSESMLVMNRDFYNRFVAAKAGGRFAWRVNGQIDDVLILDESGYLRSPIGFVGNLTGNADSATQLAAHHTIWGQSFDGTSDINGNIYFSAGGNYKIGTPYSVGHEVLYNYITFGAAETGIEYVSGKWTSDWNLVAHRFATNHSDYAIAIINSGNVAIGSTEAIEKLTVHGNILATGAITMFSQLSLKNVLDYDGLSLEQLSLIKPARFTWKDGRDSLVHAGGIADEVMQVLPEVVYKTSDDKLTMDYGSAGFFVATSLIKPVIDHEQRLQSAEKEIKDLKAENKRLREQLRAS